jgi:hypothetical protein
MDKSDLAAGRSFPDVVKEGGLEQINVVGSPIVHRVENAAKVTSVEWCEGEEDLCLCGGQLRLAHRFVFVSTDRAERNDALAKSMERARGARWQEHGGHR